MGFNENRAAKPGAAPPLLLMCKWLYQQWNAWRRRSQSRKILAKLSPSQLKDIGLTNEDTRRYK